MPDVQGMAQFACYCVGSDGIVWCCMALHWLSPSCTTLPCTTLPILHYLSRFCTMLHQVAPHSLALPFIIINTSRYYQLSPQKLLLPRDIRIFIVRFHSPHYQLNFIGLHHHLHQIDCLQYIFIVSEYQTDTENICLCPLYQIAFSCSQT